MLVAIGPVQEKYLICHVTSPNHMIEGSCNFMIYHYTAQETVTIFDLPENFVFFVVILTLFTIKLQVTQLEKLPER